MNRRLLAPMFLAGALTGCRQEAPPPTVPAELLARLEDYFAAVNARDPQRFLTFFTTEGLTVIEDKDVYPTRKAFEGFVDGFFQGVSEIRATWEQRTVHILSPECAVVTGSFRVAAKDAKGAPMAFRSAFTFVLVKREGRWLVKHVHESSLDPVAAVSAGK